MTKLFVLAGAVLAVFLVSASPAAAQTFTCNGVFTSQTVDDVEVPRDGACTLINSTVTGDVDVWRGAYFEADNTDIGDDVEANYSLTLFVHNGSTVGDSVRSFKTAQAFVFDSTVTGKIQVIKSLQTNVCGNTVVNGDIKVDRSSRDILVGDPLTVGCAGNTVQRGDIEVTDNDVDVELVVRGNTIADDLEVIGNSGPAAKFVENNAGGDDLKCFRNREPFTASGNTGWDEKSGQCEDVFECDGAFTGVTADKVVVESDQVCTLTNSTVGGDVRVKRNAYFEASNTDIGGDVKGENALTLFIDAGSTVGGRVRSYNTAQAFVFNSTVTGNIEVTRAQQTNICGTTVVEGDIKVNNSTRDILVGDPLAVGCPGNTVQQGDIEVEHNTVDVELVIRGNTIFDDLEVVRNRGDAAKFVDNNAGGDDLKCFGNSTPFTATGNTGWDETSGQCAVL